MMTKITFMLYNLNITPWTTYLQYTDILVPSKTTFTPVQVVFPTANNKTYLVIYHSLVATISNMY